MAVLIEAISVVIRKDAVDNKYPGGLPAFLRSAVPNSTLCQDSELLRVGFMAPADVQDYIEQLETCGLTYTAEGKAMDLAVVDQLRGLTTECDWLEFGQLPFSDAGRVSACWFFDGPRIAAGLHLRGNSMQLVTPPDWEFEGSLSQKPGFVATEEVKSRMVPLGTDDGIQTFQDTTIGKKVYVGSPYTGPRQEEFEALRSIAKRAMELDNQADQARRTQNEKAAAEIYEQLMSISNQAKDWVARAQFNVGFAHFAYGLVLRVLQERDRAAEQFKASLNYSPDVINTLLELTRCLGELGRPADAEEFARRAVSVAPKSASAWGNLAAVMENLNRKREAREAIQHALKLDPQDQINIQIARAIGWIP